MTITKPAFTHMTGPGHAGEDPHHPNRTAGQFLVGRREALPLEIVPDEGLDEPRPGDVLLEDRVEAVEAALDGAEEGLHPDDEKDDDRGGEDKDRQHDQGKPRACQDH
jgi:hypothetical protein